MYKLLQNFLLATVLTCTVLFGQDSQRLVALYTSTNGDNWVNNSNWLSDRPISDWYGITAQNGMVTAINLPNNRLSGNIPTEIGEFRSLNSLNLSSNRLSGLLPKEIGNLIELEILDLSNNGFTSKIPSEVGKLNNLKILNLSNNQFSAAIPKNVGNLINLRTLDLTNNRLQFNLPPALFELTKLTILNLKQNALSGTIPKTIGNLKQLNTLDLSKNIFTGEIPKEIGKLIKLEKRLALDHNNLTGRIPKQIGQLRKLEHLWLNNNQLTGKLPDDITKLNQLKSLFIYQNKLSGNVPKAIGELSNLEIFYGQNNNFQGQIPNSLWTIQTLNFLNLSYNNLSGSLAKDLRQLKTVLSINLNHNRISSLSDTLYLPESLASINLSENFFNCNSETKIQNPLPVFYSGKLTNRIFGLANQRCNKYEISKYSASDEVLDFGMVPVTTISRKSLKIYNNGTTQLELQFSNDMIGLFDLKQKSITINPHKSTIIEIEFIPAKVETYYDNLSISNNLDAKELNIRLIGSGMRQNESEKYSAIPENFVLYSNYPDPFSETTNIRFDVGAEMKVSLIVFNLGGRPIKTLVNSIQTPGHKSVIWDGTNNEGNRVEPGEYICTMQAGMFIQIRTMVVAD